MSNMSAQFHEWQDGEYFLLPPMPKLRASPDDSDSVQATFETFKPEILTKYGPSMELYHAFAIIKDENGNKSFPFKGPSGSGMILYKLAFGQEAAKELQIEIDLYCGELRKLQGMFIPIFRGYFEGKQSDGTVVGCMVVESLGKSRAGFLEPKESDESDESDHATTQPIKQAMVDALLAIHKAGVQYGVNLSRMLITRDPTKRENLRIADFSSATTGHVDCKQLGLADSSSYKAHTVTTSKLPIECCPELFNLCQKVRFWAPSKIIYGEDSFPVDPEFNVYKLVQRADPSMTERWQTAFQCYIHYTKAWGPEGRHKELIKERVEWEKQNAEAKSNDVKTDLPHGTIAL